MVFHAPPGSPLAGVYRGKDEVFAFLGGVMQRSEARSSSTSMTSWPNDEHGVALLHARAHHAGKTLDEDVVHVIHIKDGNLGEFRGLWSDPGAFDAFFS